MRYYVYQLIDPRDGAVFYVGKGQLHRMYQHSSASDNRALGFRIREIESERLDVVREKIFYTDDEQRAYDYEVRLIAEIGLENLCNIMPGGDGVIFTDEVRKKMVENHQGMKEKTHSAETKRKMSKAAEGNTHLLGHEHSPATRDKMSKAKKDNPVCYWLGKTPSPETRRKQSEARYKYLELQKETVT